MAPAPTLAERERILLAEVDSHLERALDASTLCGNLREAARYAVLGGGKRLRPVPGRYQLWLGGNASGTRLNRVFKDTVKDADVETELRPLLTRWKEARQPGERFGDFAARVLWAEVTTT